MKPADETKPGEAGETIGPYLLHRQIARGGMATIHLARMVGDEGFSRIVAAKRMLPELTEDAEFAAMFIDEAKIASKIHHRNVVPVLDVVTSGKEVILVQEYVHGVPLNILLKAAHTARERMPPEIAVSIACQVLVGLQAAHETMGTNGTPLDIIHRDISPGNVIIALDGTARIVDFGVARAASAVHITRVGTFKGKRSYSAPESLQGHATQQSDVYSLSVVLWEMLVGRRLLSHDQARIDELIERIMQGNFKTVTQALAKDRERIDERAWLQLRAIEPIVKHGLERNPAVRWKSAGDMERALRACLEPASPGDVAVWVKRVGKEFVDERDALLAAEESAWRAQAKSVSSSPPRVRRTRAFQAPRPDVPRSKRWRLDLIVIVLCLLIAALIFVAAKDRLGSATPSNAAPPDTTIDMPTVTTPLQVDASTEPADATLPVDGASPPADAELSDASLEDAGEVQMPPPPPVASTKATRPVIRKRIVKAPVRRPNPIVHSTSPTTTAPENNCSPPYYFKGTKKIFKPECL